MSGYDPVLSRLAQLGLSTLAILYQDTFPDRPVPVRAKTGEQHRDLFLAALLSAPERGRVERPYPGEAS